MNFQKQVSLKDGVHTELSQFNLLASSYISYLSQIGLCFPLLFLVLTRDYSPTLLKIPTIDGIPCIATFLAWQLILLRILCFVHCNPTANPLRARTTSYTSSSDPTLHSDSFTGGTQQVFVNCTCPDLLWLFLELHL